MKTAYETKSAKKYGVELDDFLAKEHARLLA